MLERYFAILSHDADARYLRAKGHGTGLRDIGGLPQRELWALHDEELARLKAGAEGTDGASLLDVKAELARRIMSSCRLCERRCGANRLGGKTGVCGVGRRSYVSSEFLHFGEEPELVPSHTVFLSGCTLKCVYCQNFDIATRPEAGRPVEIETLARAVEARHGQGARNVNFVGGDPTPHLWTILRVLPRVDINTPVVWNSNMYLSSESMKLLDGVVDVYLADFRYGNDGCAKKYSDVERYIEVVSRNFATAFAQAEVMLRHLVLPGHVECCTEPVMAWCAEHLPGVYFNLMFQYHPCYRASLYPEMDRLLTAQERHEALALAARYGIVCR